MAIVPFTSLLTGSSSPLLAAGDVLAFVDVSDSTQAPAGSTVKATLTQFFAAIPVPVVVTSASANALAVGLAGATNSAFLVDASTASQAAGLKVTGATAAGTVAVVVISSGAAANLTLNAKGSGTIGIGSASTGAVTITPALAVVGAVSLSSTLTLPTAAAGRIILGSSTSLREDSGILVVGNSAGNARNGIAVSTGNYSGLITLDAGVALTGTLTMATAVSKVVPGATSWGVRNNADSADNIIITDAGNLTLRGTVGGVTTLTATTVVAALTGNVTGNVTGDVTGNVTGNVSGSSGSTTGNAATATALQTARTIGGTSFDGTANITVATATGGFTVSGGNLALGTNTLTLTGSIGATGARVTKGWFTDLEVTNAIAGSITGLAATATALATPRAINGVNFDGTAAITVTAAAGTLSGGTLAAGVTASSLTSVGTLTALTVSGVLTMSTTGAAGRIKLGASTSLREDSASLIVSNADGTARNGLFASTGNFSSTVDVVKLQGASSAPSRAYSSTYTESSFAGTDTAGKFSIGPGVTAAAGTVVVVTFATAYAAAPYVTISGNPLALDKGYYVSAATTTTFTVTARVADPAGAFNHEFYYHVIG